jgi:undecaprenyl-diphosphatase
MSGGSHVSRTPTPSVERWDRRPLDAYTAAVGLVLVALGMVAVRDSEVSAFEEDVFFLVNHLPQALYPVFWPFQQAGNLVVGPLVAVAAAILKRYRLAAAALCATVLKLVLERVVKAMVSRNRPGTAIEGDDVELRGDVHAGGESFVSGHAVLITALAVLVTPYLPGRWKIVPWAVVGSVFLTRVYVGAHLPLDVICGGGVGLLIGGVLNLAFGVPASRAGSPVDPPTAQATAPGVT